MFRIEEDDEADDSIVRSLLKEWLTPFGFVTS